MATLDQYLPALQPHVPDCPSHIIRNTVREALRLICDDCPVWQLKEPAAFMQDITEYDIAIPEQAELVEVLAVTLASGTQLMDWHLTMDNQISIPAKRVGELELGYIDLCLRPALDANEIPDALFSRTSTLIPHGARWLLLDMPGKPWSDPVKAEYYRTRFYQQMGILRGNLINATQKHKLAKGAPPLA